MSEDLQKSKYFRFPPSYFNISWIAMIILHLTIPVYKFLEFPFNLTGILFMLTGLWMNIWASNYYNKVNTTVKPFQTSTQLITTGFYKYSRHPMYLGMVVALLGIVLLLGSLSPILVLPIFMRLISRKFMIPEEEMLLNTFGEAYERYKTQVRRWI